MRIAPRRLAQPSERSEYTRSRFSNRAGVVALRDRPLEHLDDFAGLFERHAIDVLFQP